MKLRVSDILKRKGGTVITVDLGTTIIDAVRKMRSNKIGALLVIGSGGRIEGIFSERDAMRALDEKGGSTLGLKVDDYMTKNIIVAVPEDEIEYIMGIMTKNRIRHIPVMGKEGLAGMVSIGDLVKSKLEDMELENRLLSDYIAKG